MHESKGQHIGKAPSLHLFHTAVSVLELRAESAPIHAVSMSRVDAGIMSQRVLWVHI